MTEHAEPRSQELGRLGTPDSAVCVDALNSFKITYFVSAHTGRVFLIQPIKHTLPQSQRI
jgi:hypothetical protein